MSGVTPSASIWSSEVGRDRVRAAGPLRVEFVGERGQLVGRARDQHYPMPASVQFARDLRADPRRRTGDDGPGLCTGRRQAHDVDTRALGCVDR
jgi:hypothetical protein